MDSHGKAETERLRKNLEDQMDRLAEQLNDIEECRDSISESEYKTMKQETLEQLEECHKSLRRVISGDMTLVNEQGASHLATQSAISAAFQTPAVIRMFSERVPDQLRERLASIERDLRLGKLTKEASEWQKGEVLTALKHLGQKLEPAELDLLKRISSGAPADGSFVPVSDSPDKGEIALAIAIKEVRDAQNS